MRICTFYNVHWYACNWMLQEECVQNWRRWCRQQQQQRQQQKRNNITSNHNSYPAKNNSNKNRSSSAKSAHIYRAAIDTPAIQKVESELAENCHQCSVFFINYQSQYIIPRRALTEIRTRQLSGSETRTETALARCVLWAHPSGTNCVTPNQTSGRLSVVVSWYHECSQPAHTAHKKKTEPATATSLILSTETI